MRAAVVSVADALTDLDGTLQHWNARHREAQGGGPAYWALDLVFDAGGPAGWAGWIPYQEHDSVWQSSTWLAPRLRGRGLVPVIRCHQAHRAEQLVRYIGNRPIRFVSSVDELNARSLRASQRYATSHGWPQWALTHERVRGRTAWVVEWPLPTPHTCFGQ